MSESLVELLKVVDAKPSTYVIEVLCVIWLSRALLGLLGSRNSLRGWRTLGKVLVASHQFLESGLERDPKQAFSGPDWLMRPLAAASMATWYAAALVMALTLVAASLSIMAGPPLATWMLCVGTFVIYGYALRYCVRVANQARRRAWGADEPHNRGLSASEKLSPLPGR